MGRSFTWVASANAALLSALLLSDPATAAENRCGWLMNPTPANWWLTDKDGAWTLMSQGEEPRDEVMENLPDFDEDQYVASNGNYGYGCACLSVDVDKADSDHAGLLGQNPETVALRGGHIPAQPGIAGMAAHSMPRWPDRPR